MAAAALAAGVLGSAGSPPHAAQPAHHGVLAPRPAPRAARRVSSPSDPHRTSSSESADHPYRQSHSSQRSFTESPISDTAWSAPLETHHAPVPSSTASAAASSPHGAGGGVAALAAGGVAAAPLERAIEPEPTTSPAPATHPNTSADPHASAGGNAGPGAQDLDHLAEEVLNKLRWRLVIERERLMG
jgi:hypothetical protein